MKKKILVTMMTLGFISSVLAAPSGIINMDDTKTPSNSMRMPVDGERPMPRPKLLPPMPRDIVEGDMGSNKNPLRRNMDSMFCDWPPRAPEEYMMVGNTMPGASNTMPVKNNKISSSSTMPDLKLGDGNKNGKGMHVKILQARLIEGGYMSGTTTGNFGALTREAVKKYQKDIGIAKPTGLFGPQTKQKIRAKCTPLNSGSGETLPGTPSLPM